MLGGVFIRMGSVIMASGVRVVSGLIQRVGSFSFISDNAGCLGGRPFPRNGRIMSFGSHEVYVGTESVCREQVLVAADPPLSMDFVSQEHGVPRDGPKRFERRGLNV
jgi:hypothetical protein